MFFTIMYATDYKPKSEFHSFVKEKTGLSDDRMDRLKKALE